MGEQIRLGELTVQVSRKEIKNVHLSVYPPNGSVRIAAPSRISLPIIRVYAISKLPWIRQQQRKLQQQERETPREYIDRESHYVWGKRYLLKVIEKDVVPRIELKPRRLFLQVRPHATIDKKHELLNDWYRTELKEAVRLLLKKWQKTMAVSVNGFYVQSMKTKWGSCNPKARTIRLNTELAKKPPQCLEYIVVHELAHLLEPTHNRRFVALMDRFMPKWQFHRDELNRLPVRHETWGY